MIKAQIRNFTITVQWIHFLQSYFLKIEENSKVVWSSTYSLEERKLNSDLIYYILLGFGLMPDDAFFKAIEAKEHCQALFGGNYEPILI